MCSRLCICFVELIVFVFGLTLYVSALQIIFYIRLQTDWDWTGKSGCG